MTRKKARELMMQIFFQMEACNDFDINNMAKYFENKEIKTQREYCEELFSILCNKRQEIDAVIDSNSKGWKIDRLPKTDLAVIRVAVCEMKYIKAIPHAVSINEAVELSKIYGTDDSPSYINAILGKVEKESNEDD